MSRAKKNTDLKPRVQKTSPTPTKPAKAVKASEADAQPAKQLANTSDEEIFAKEYWTGDSRDGVLVNGDGYHFFRMTKAGKILEAYEFYESEDGREFACPLPEMLNVNWIIDLGFEDFDALDAIKELDFQRVKDIAKGIRVD